MPEELLDQMEEELLDNSEQTFEEFDEMMAAGCTNESDKMDYYRKGFNKAIEIVRKYRAMAKA
jgi:predicted alpha/beta-fold hydrolase